MKIKLVQKFGELIKDTKYYIVMSYVIDEEGQIYHQRIRYDESLNSIIYDDNYEFSDSFEAIFNYEKCLDYYKKPDANIVIREAEIFND